ncbi:MAG TPA: MgtC/SapB family protein [Thermoanaerobaculia bacterium]|nr:MgtC/SapB family protein [Thermoanaerobaculia bacterium]
MIELSTAVIQLGLAIAFGAFVGVEREWRQKHAGLKTMVLVCLGAATFSMMTDTFGPGNANPGQIAAAVVGGIGFIGAGVIMHRGATVQGVTTAATLWAVASIGVAVGLGHNAVAAVLTASILIVQFVMRWCERAIANARRGSLPGRFELRVDCDGETYPMVSSALARHAELVVLRRSIAHGAEHLQFRAVIRAPHSVDLTPLEAELVSLAGVRKVDVWHLGVDED